VKRSYPKILRNRKRRIQRRLDPERGLERSGGADHEGNIHYEMAEKPGRSTAGASRDPSDGQQTGVAARDRLPAAWAPNAFPTRTTSGDFTHRFEEADILNLMEITNTVRQRVWRQQPRGFLTEAFIDTDGTIAPTLGECKGGMSAFRLSRPPRRRMRCPSTGVRSG
jgi:hypothetical protein